MHISSKWKEQTLSNGFALFDKKYYKNFEALIIPILSFFVISFFQLVRHDSLNRS